ncbi:Hypothetical protein CINCED_3A019290 [Cinara cedri]|uniref:Uncharacterized protein n=1 Tax=Cinara cedri TaxID=506608 RepID=A0A5E4MK63_9HEMI|nr:Hypothetical protein CINCED_3A019290 [Cinara cedri]
MNLQGCEGNYRVSTKWEKTKRLTTYDSIKREVMESTGKIWQTMVAKLIRLIRERNTETYC